MVGRDLVELHCLPHRLAGEVHIRLGLHHQALGPGEGDDVIGGFELDLVQLHPRLLRQQVHGEKAHVVAGVLILGPGISQAHHQPVHGGGFGA